MALTTRDNRSSAVLWGLPFARILPHPDAAAENQGDRQQLARSYRGILAAGEVFPDGVKVMRRKRIAVVRGRRR